GRRVVELQAAERTLEVLALGDGMLLEAASAPDTRQLAGRNPLDLARTLTRRADRDRTQHVQPDAAIRARRGLHGRAVIGVQCERAGTAIRILAFRLHFAGDDESFALEHAAQQRRSARYRQFDRESYRQGFHWILPSIGTLANG